MSAGLEGDQQNRIGGARADQQRLQGVAVRLRPRDGGQRSVREQRDGGKQRPRDPIVEGRVPGYLEKGGRIQKVELEDLWRKCR